MYMCVYVLYAYIYIYIWCVSRTSVPAFACYMIRKASAAGMTGFHFCHG